jgi:methyltransferase (TIGR00027 family)
MTIIQAHSPIQKKVDMDRKSCSIKNIADTARWMAFYRAMESERFDALFHDPYARLLADKQGKEIAHTLPWGINNAWATIVRTCVFDEIIMQIVENHAVDTILNLAAGFDTRPYRLPLPASLHWIEVDLPEIIAEKEKKLANVCPRCHLTQIKLDLADVNTRNTFFSRLDQEAWQVLVVTEGLLIYLTTEQVTTLAQDLRTHSHFRWWLTDLVSPLVLQQYQICWYRELTQGNVTLQFAPREGELFFSHAGWHVVEFRSVMEEAARLHREMAFGAQWRRLVNCSCKALQETYRKMSSFILLERD